MSHLTALAVVALITAPSAADLAAFKADVAAAPADVRSFIERQRACDAKLGGEATPPPLTAAAGDLNPAPLTDAEMNCEDLSQDEQSLRDRYDERLRVLNLLDRAAENAW